MKVQHPVILISIAAFLGGCTHLFPLKLQQTEQAAPEAEIPAPPTTLPDMPDWVKFVRFRSHTHEVSVFPVRDGMNPNVSLSAFTPASFVSSTPDEATSLEPAPYTLTASSVDSDTASLPFSPDIPIDAHSSGENESCQGQGGYVDAASERWLSERQSDRWTIQLISARDATEPCVDQYLADLNVHSARRYAVYFENAIWHIAILGDYPDAASALKAAKRYPAPWVRKFADLRSRRCASVRRVRSLGSLINPWCDTRPVDLETSLVNPVADSAPDNGVPRL